MTKRGRILSFGSAALLVMAGGIGSAVVGGTVGQVLALALISLGLVLATGLVFLEVGLSEDKERAQEAERRQAAQRQLSRDNGSQQRQPKARPRLARLRGSRRRLR